MNHDPADFFGAKALKEAFAPVTAWVVKHWQLVLFLVAVGVLALAVFL